MTFSEALDRNSADVSFTPVSKWLCEHKGINDLHIWANGDMTITTQDGECALYYSFEAQIWHFPTSLQAKQGATGPTTADIGLGVGR